MDAGSAEMLQRLTTIEVIVSRMEGSLDKQHVDTQREIANVSASAKAAHNRIDGYPKAETIVESLKAQQAVERRLDRVLWMIAGAVFVAGGAGGAIGAVIGG